MTLQYCLKASPSKHGIKIKKKKKKRILLSDELFLYYKNYTILRAARL